MKRISCFFLVCLLCVLPVFASPSEPAGDGLGESAFVEADEVSPEEDPSIVVQVETPSAEDIASAIGDVLRGDDFVDVPENYTLVDVVSYPVQPLYLLDNGSSADSKTGLKAIITSLIGDYNPVVVQFRYQSNTSTNYTYVNEIMPDYAWLCSCGIFALMLFCTFRLGGALLRKI